MAADDARVKALLGRAEMTAKYLVERKEKGDRFLVVSHLDADGLAAAGIIGLALQRCGAFFQIRIERWFDEKVARELSVEKNSTIVLTDMGSGYLNILNAKMKDNPTVILDHHPPVEKAKDSFVHVNPHLFGIDGANEISGAGTTYLVAKSLSAENVDLACIGVVGALGDMQDKYEERSLGGVNTIIVDDGTRAGYLETKTDLLFFGRETRPIHKALAYTTTPFIPEISGEEDRSLSFLMGLGIEPKENDRWRALRDLSHEEKQKIFSSLSEHFASKGYKGDVVTRLLGTVYTLKKEEPWTPLRDAREFALLLNATGRMDKASLGVGICMGDRRKSLAEAKKTLDGYRQTITKYLKWLENNPEIVEELENIYVLRGEQIIDEKIISAISSILSTSLPNSDKPLVAYSVIPEDESIKISARTTENLTSKGFSIGEILRICAEKYDGKGGGHDIAAGAQVPFKSKEAFLHMIDDMVGIHLSGLKNNGSKDNTSV